jgi:hypothetical protein
VISLNRGTSPTIAPSGSYGTYSAPAGAYINQVTVSGVDCTNTVGVIGISATPDGLGYYQGCNTGNVFAYGDAASGYTQNPTNAAAIAEQSHNNTNGVLIVSPGGAITTSNAIFYGSLNGTPLNAPIVGIAMTPDNQGYWLVASDGGVFAFGDATFYGSMGGTRLNQPVVGIAADDATGGYWLVAADGGVFSFHAPFYGSTGNIHLNKPIVGMEAAPNGAGYRFVASDGGVFDFNLPFVGSLGGNPPSSPVVGMAASGASGYWLAEHSGVVVPFGSAPNLNAGAPEPC